MNLSDDPSERLIDSLLREQRNGRADEALLREIAAGLDVAKHEAVQRSVVRRRNYVAAAAVVAFLCFIGLSWSAVHRAIEKSRQLEAARKAESARHASVLAAERQRLEAEFRATKPASPPAGTGKQGGTRPVAANEIQQPLPGEPETEGLNLRFVAMDKGILPGEIFAHDPDGQEGARGKKLVPLTYLAGSAGRMNFKGSKIVLTNSADPASLEGSSSVLASSYVGQSAGRGIMLLLPGTGKPGDPPAQLLFVDDRLGDFPAGSTLLVNASSKDLSFKLEKETLNCRSGDQMLIEKMPLGRNRMTRMEGFFQTGEQWRVFVSSAWPEVGPDVRVLQVCFDGGSPEIQIMGLREDLGATLASDAGEPKAAGAGEGEEAKAQPEVLVNGEIKMGAKDPEADLVHLAFVKSAATKWYVQFGFESEGKWSPRFTGMTPLGKRLQNKVSAMEMLSVGDVFFGEGTIMAGRFKFTGMVERDIVSKRTNLQQRVKIAQYEDLRGLVPGRLCESQSGLPEADLESMAYQDPTAVFEFSPDEGEKKTFEVQVGERFSLPPGEAQQRYLLKSMDGGSATLEYLDQAGQAKTSTLRLK